MGSLEHDFRQAMYKARESVGAAGKMPPKPPHPDGLSEDQFERLVFETTPIGVLELWVNRLAREVDKLRAELAKRDGNG